MPPKRMTANPVRPARYRPGKPVAPEASSSEEEDEVEEEDEDESAPASRPAAPRTSTDPSRVASTLNKVDLNERRRQIATAEAARQEEDRVARAQEEEGFVTEEESEPEKDNGARTAEGSSSEEESSEEEEESSEEEAPKRPMMRPTFIKKDKRQFSATKNHDPDAEELQLKKDEDARQKAADELVQDQLRKDAEARAAGRRDWDDEDAAEIDAVDDTDDLDPEAERAAWKLRELRRVKREREAIEEAEKEREELERRRNLTAEERDAEDQAYVTSQREERDSGRGKMGFMQKYHHKGAFFQDDAKAQGLDRRDLMGSRYQDDVSNRELLPQYMQIRDMSKLGKKGGTKYKDLKSEDTGRWADYGREPRAGGRDALGGGDERFMPDRKPTGANASEVKERRRPPVEGAPAGPRATRAEDDRGAGSGGRAGDSYRPGEGARRGRAEDERDESKYAPRERDLRVRDRPRRSYSRSQSRERSPRGGRRHGREWDDHNGRDRRKRSPSSADDRRGYDGDKRRRLDVR